MTARPVAGSLFPDIQPDRPTGPVPLSVQYGTNADLIATIAPMYLTGSVLDVTYGNGDTAGGWWRRFTPDPLTFHDLAIDGVDFRDLPHGDDSFDAVCFDPPYVPQGGMSSNRVGEQDFRRRFGLMRESTPVADTFELMDAGLVECARVTRQWVLCKCADFVSSGKFHLGSLRMMDTARQLGLGIHDVIIHASGSGPGGHNIFTPIRCRRAHSYLLVLSKGAS